MSHCRSLSAHRVVAMASVISASSMRLSSARRAAVAQVSKSIGSLRLLVAAPDANRAVCAADSPVTGGAARRAQHQADFS